jgi:protein-tyrosine phosphatase/arsenate reductase
MFPKIEKLCQKLESEHDSISEERKQVLEHIASAVDLELEKKGNVKLIYICTHNSRRSHFGQIWANVAAEFYGISSLVEAYSGGTEVTALHPNSITALEKMCFEISSDAAITNPRYQVKFGDEMMITCFSKGYDDSYNPEKDFLAIMTCSHADENCPFISGATERFSTPYEDPKIFDGLKLQDKKYLECALEIGKEVFYMMSVVAASKKDNAYHS